MITTIFMEFEIKINIEFYSISIKPYTAKFANYLSKQKRQEGFGSFVTFRNKFMPTMVR